MPHRHRQPRRSSENQRRSRRLLLPQQLQHQCLQHPAQHQRLLRHQDQAPLRRLRSIYRFLAMKRTTRRLQRLRRRPPYQLELSRRCFWTAKSRCSQWTATSGKRRRPTMGCHERHKAMPATTARDSRLRSLLRPPESAGIRSTIFPWALWRRLPLLQRHLEAMRLDTLLHRLLRLVRGRTSPRRIWPAPWPCSPASTRTL